MVDKKDNRATSTSTSNDRKSIVFLQLRSLYAISPYAIHTYVALMSLLSRSDIFFFYHHHVAAIIAVGGCLSTEKPRCLPRGHVRVGGGHMSSISGASEYAKTDGECAHAVNALLVVNTCSPLGAVLASSTCVRYAHVYLRMMTRSFDARGEYIYHLDEKDEERSVFSRICMPRVYKFTH